MILLRGRTLTFASLTVASALIVSAPAGATVVADAAGDFIPTFVGTKSGDLDVLSVSGTYDGSAFHIGATVNGDVGTLPSALYVFGFNRGAASSNFAAIGLPGVVFDAVITMTGAGVTGGRDLVSNTAITLPPGSSQIAGSSFEIDIPAALLPSEGLAPGQYGVNLWPRDASTPAGNGQIADFAPDATDFTVSSSQETAVPEPWSLAVLASSLIGVALLRWRARSAAASSFSTT